MSGSMKMDMEKFADCLANRNAEFVKFWYEQNRKDPENFPAAMSKSDWWEQFGAWEMSR